MIYDIRTEQAAAYTLNRLTGVSDSLWRQNAYRERDFECIDYYVDAMINNYGTKQLPQSYMDMEYIYFHVTTSGNECRSIQKYGILDLKNAYECRESELRMFLDENDVFIDLDRAVLTYQGMKYDIKNGNPPWNHESIAYKSWSIGRKIYFDYTTCGFLSAWKNAPYGGQVHRRPEILFDIDELLGTNLSYQWECTHSPYEIVAKVSGRDICYPGYDEEPEKEKLMSYIVKAYNTAMYGTTEEILLMRNGVQISPDAIIQINPLTIWS